MGERMKGGAVMDDRSPENPAKLHKHNPNAHLKSVSSTSPIQSDAKWEQEKERERGLER